MFRNEGNDDTLHSRSVGKTIPPAHGSYQADL
jgi:hypothetical protein